MPEVEKLYDVELLAQAHQSDPSFEKEIISLFIKNIPQTTAHIKNAFKAEDWKMVGFYAHKLKASVDFFNLNAIKNIVRDIEIKAKNMAAADRDAMHEEINFISAYITKCVAAMKKDYAIE